MPKNQNRLSIRIWQLFEGSAEGPLAIAALLALFFGVVLMRVFGLI